MAGRNPPPSRTPIHGLYRRLVTQFVSSTATSTALGIPFYLLGVNLTVKQMRMAGGLIIPIAALTPFVTGYRVLIHDFRPFRKWLNESPGNINHVPSEMLGRALNLPLLSTRRILSFHGSLFALVTGMLIPMAHHLMVPQPSSMANARCNDSVVHGSDRTPHV